MNRNHAVDAYRGFVMLLMMAESSISPRSPRPSPIAPSGPSSPTTRPMSNGSASDCRSRKPHLNV